MQLVTNTRPRILVADDMAMNRVIVKHVFDFHDYDVIDAENGQQVLELLASQSFDVVILDIMMPELDGFETCRRIRQQADLLFLPVIILTTLDQPENIAKGMEAGATDYVVKPFDFVELEARVKAAIERKRLTDRLDDTEGVLFSIARLIEAREATTEHHCDRLMTMCQNFGATLGLPEQQLYALVRGSILHDIGMLTVPEAILLKRDKLTHAEWRKIKTHTVIGSELCLPLRTMRDTVDIIACHHERWDGTGYPRGLKGENIPLLARIFQIVDIYDALCTERPYRPALHRDRAIEIMLEETAKGWRDPDLMQKFQHLIESGRGLMKTDTARLADIW